MRRQSALDHASSTQMAAWVIVHHLRRLPTRALRNDRSIETATQQTIEGQECVLNSYVLAWGAGIGDVVLSTPMFVSLRSSQPRGKIVAIGNSSNKRILEWLAELGYIDEVVTVPASIPGTIKIFFQLARTFRARFVMLHTIKSAKIPWLLSPLIHLNRKSIGFRKRSRMERWITRFDQSRIPDDRALKDAYALMGESISNETANDLVETARSTISAWASKKPSEQQPTSQIVVGLHLGTGPGVEVKSLKRERWQPLLKSLRKRGAMYIMFGGPDEPATAPPEWNDSTDQSLVGRSTLSEFTIALSICDLFIGNDGGPMHLAGLLDIPTIAFFGASDPVRQHPLTNRFFLIEPGCWCQHTSRTVGEIACPNPDGPICRDMIISEDILNDVDTWLDVELEN